MLYPLTHLSNANSTDFRYEVPWKAKNRDSNQNPDPEPAPFMHALMSLTDSDEQRLL